MKYLKKLVSSSLLLFFTFSFCLNVYNPTRVLAKTIEKKVVEEPKNRIEVAKPDKIETVITQDGTYPELKLESKEEQRKGIVGGAKSLASKVGAEDLPTSYRTTGLTVKDQMNTGECWAFTATTVLEAYDIKQGKIKQTYSPRHIDYSCSKSFSDLNLVTDPLLNRETSEDVGNNLLTMAYLSRGKGPVLEKDYPFVDNCNSKVQYSSLNKHTEEIVKDFIFFTPICKKYNGNTITYYQDPDFDQESFLSSSEVEDLRKKIKLHIKNNGAIGTMVYQVYTNTDMYNGASCSSNEPNHAITIIGWDDNYQAASWPKKGAYICQNSYGTGYFDGGIMYVSYDDKFVERGMFGISNTEINEIDNIYEHDEWGSSSLISSEELVNDEVTQHNDREITAVNVFSRDTSQSELLEKVGVTSWSLQKAEIYVTEKFTLEGEPYGYTKIGETGTLDYGYHVIDVSKPFTLTNNKYAVAVRFIEDNEEDIATASVETYSDNSSDWWYGVKGNIGESYFVDMFNPNSENLYWIINQPRSETVMTNAGVKVYTKNVGEVDPPAPPSEDPEDLITSDEYTVNGKFRRITMVEENTTCQTFKSELTVNTNKYPEYAGQEIVIVDSNKKPVADDGIVKTGYIVMIANSEYEVAVRGDINCDGKRNILDLVRLRGHLVGYSDQILTGIRYYAGDVNDSGKIDIIDLSLMRWLLVQ